MASEFHGAPAPGLRDEVDALIEALAYRRGLTDCRLCEQGHGDLVCDCGCRHDEHTFAVGCRFHQNCHQYSQKKLNRTPGLDVRTGGGES